VPLSVRAVRHRYSDRHPWVLRGLDLEIADGSSVALMGPSGSGKTTLLSVLGLLTQPTEGQVAIDGAPVTAASRAAGQIRAEQFSWVFQTANALLRRSALENASLQLLARGLGRRSAEQVALEELERLGMGALVGRRCRLLSGGELQRVCIARALAAAPRWILADEPTGQLDHTTTLDVVDALIDGRPVGTSVIIATHDAEVAGRCGRVLRLLDGTIQSDTGR